MNGIIAHLSRVHQENARTVRIVPVSASTTASELRNVLDLRDQTSFVNNDNPNRWIQYTTEKWRVRPTHYASGSYFDGGPGIIEGSNEGIISTEIDHGEENSELNPRGAIATYPIAERGSQRKMLPMSCKSLRFGFGFCT
jgi:hypothetical protein